MSNRVSEMMRFLIMNDIRAERRKDIQAVDCFRPNVSWARQAEAENEH